MQLSTLSGSIITVSPIDHGLHGYSPRKILRASQTFSARSQKLNNILDPLSAIIVDRSWSENQKTIGEVHKHVCGHSNYSDMKLFLQRNRIWRDHSGDYLKRKVEYCKHCLLVQTPEGIRKVSLSSISQSFSDAVCIDHMYLDKCTICHNMYSATRYSAGSVAESSNMT